jgi:hypothetical protein
MYLHITRKLGLESQTNCLAIGRFTFEKFQQNFYVKPAERLEFGLGHTSSSILKPASRNLIQNQQDFIQM